MHRTASRPVEHPQGNFLWKANGIANQAAACDRAKRLLDDTANDDRIPKPRMPGIQYFAFIGNLGLQSSSCTIMSARTRHSPVSPPQRSKHKSSGPPRGRLSARPSIQNGDFTRQTRHNTKPRTLEMNEGAKGLTSRPIATRYDRHAENYLSGLALAALICEWT